jgi:hypothetical protein
MEPDDLLSLSNAQNPKDGEGAARRLFCSQNAHSETVIVRRPQSKAPHALAWLGIEAEKKTRIIDVRSRRSIGLISERKRASLEGLFRT